MNFFIDRPIFASAIALLMVLAGAISMLVLPVSQYPPLVPPQVQVSTQYIGGSADVVDGTVTTPLEEQLNGAAGMIYMSSSSTNNGDSIINLTFEVGFDQDIGQMEALTRSNEALSELPPEVQQVGLTIEKYSTNLLLGVNLTSPNGTHDGIFLQNYADIHLADPLARIPGVALVNNFGLSKYAMRIWLDPGKLTNLGLTATRCGQRHQGTEPAGGRRQDRPGAGTQGPAVSISAQHPGPSGTGRAVRRHHPARPAERFRGAHQGRGPGGTGRRGIRLGRQDRTASPPRFW